MSAKESSSHHNDQNALHSVVAKTLRSLVADYVGEAGRVGGVFSGSRQGRHGRIVPDPRLPNQLIVSAIAVAKVAPVLKLIRRLETIGIRKLRSFDKCLADLLIVAVRKSVSPAAWPAGDTFRWCYFWNPPYC